MKNRLFEEKQFESANLFGLNKKPAEAPDKTNRYILNLALLVLMGVLGIWYALWANFVISAEYREKMAKEKLGDLILENNQLLSEKSGSANLGALLVFAKTSGLVEQKNIEYLFDRSNVAHAE